MSLTADLKKQLIARLLVGILILAFFSISILQKGESGNNGMSPNWQKILPFILFFIWEAFLVIEAFYHFLNQRNSYGWGRIYTIALLGLLFFAIMYVQHQYF
ncbi:MULTISPECIES: hypothetical protein [Pedobacter]|uniref:hypothetical protein n=1 Tax=Pedobacter TaxID=84567 RepID=UPI001E28C246|nr:MULTISPECIES: hypothetical protein [Pedobacter]